MEAKLYSIDCKEKGKLKLPAQFSEEVRTDLIRRGFLAIQANSKQAYGIDPLAGTKQGKATPKRRRKFGTTYGFGISRVKRKTLSARGTRFYRVAAFVANVRGGRKAHPPLAEKNTTERINKKERRKAIRSAIAATKFDGFPIIVEDKLEKLNKTKEVNKVLDNLNLTDKIEKSKDKKVRQGRGKRRGRKYKRSKSVLFVVSKPCELSNAAKNVAGVDITSVKNLNVGLLAPGGNPGRVTIWSKAAIDELNNGNLFL